MCVRVYVYVYVYICLLLFQYTPPSHSLPPFDLSSLSLLAPSILLLPFWLNVRSRVGMRDTGYTVGMNAPASGHGKGMRRISHVKYRNLVRRGGGRLGWENSMAGLWPIVTQLTRNSTNRRPRYRTVTPVHPRTAAAPSRSLPAQHRFRIPATPLLLSFPSLPFPSRLYLSLSPSLSSTFTFPTPCYFPLRVIIPWDLLYQIPNTPIYRAHPLLFPPPPTTSIVDAFSQTTTIIRLPFNPTLDEPYFSTNLICPIPQRPSDHNSIHKCVDPSSIATILPSVYYSLERACRIELISIFLCHIVCNFNICHISRNYDAWDRERLVNISMLYAIDVVLKLSNIEHI